LFTIREVTVLNKVYSELIEEDFIVQSSNIRVGNNIFALSEKKAIKNIELANPYIMVTSIERKFPNKVVIHVNVRTPLMTMGIADSDSFALLDSDLKILNIIEPYSNLYKASTKVKGVLASSPVIGDILNKNNPYNFALVTIAYVANNENLSGRAFLTFLIRLISQQTTSQITYISRLIRE
jgi:cell division septal protein FtsQ